MPIKLDGKALADRICGDLKVRVSVLRDMGIIPRLTIVTNGRSDSSSVYVRNKLNRCKEIEIESNVRKVDKLSMYDLFYLSHLQEPVIIQMPIEREDDVTDEAISIAIGPEADVDGFANFKNIADLSSGREPVNYPCTPKGIIRILDEYKIPIEGKNVCIIGRSNIVGRPLARMMEQRVATVTLCHSKTHYVAIENAIDESSIIVSATGNMEVLRDYKYIGFYKTIIDVGMNRDENGKLCGDFQKEAYENCYAYTPVPGGIGTMTVAMLMDNVVRFYEREAGIL